MCGLLATCNRYTFSCDVSINIPFSNPVLLRSCIFCMLRVFAVFTKFLIGHPYLFVEPRSRQTLRFRFYERARV